MLVAPFGRNCNKSLVVLHILAGLVFHKSYRVDRQDFVASLPFRRHPCVGGNPVCQCQNQVFLFPITVGCLADHYLRLSSSFNLNIPRDLRLAIDTTIHNDARNLSGDERKGLGNPGEGLRNDGQGLRNSQPVDQRRSRQGPRGDGSGGQGRQRTGLELHRQDSTARRSDHPSRVSTGARPDHQCVRLEAAASRCKSYISAPTHDPGIIPLTVFSQSFVATQLALSALPLLLFFSFSVITLVVVAATAVLFAAFWIGAALLILVPTLFVTFFTALFIWIWVVGAYALWRFTYRMTTVGRNASAESRPVLPARTALQEPEPPKGVEGVYLDRQPNISSGDQERNAGLQEGPGSLPAEDGTDYDGGLEDMVVQPAAPARNGVGNNHGQGVAQGDNGIGTEYDRMLGSRAGHSGRNQYGAPNFGPGATGWGNFSNPRPAEDVSKASVERPV